MSARIEGLLKLAGITIVAWLVGLTYDAIVMPGTTLARGPATSFASVLLPALAAKLSIAAALVYPVRRSALSGRGLVLALLLIVLGIYVVLIAIEGLVVLDDVPKSDFLLGSLRDTITAALLAVLLTRAIGKRPRPQRNAAPPQRKPGGAWNWTWRIALCAIAYVFVYITAGTLIYPSVRTFHETAGLTPNPAILLPLQLVRGVLYVLFALPIIRSLVTSRWQTTLSMAVLFPILAGVAPLIVPSPVLPGWVRAYHLIETGWSNFVFGALVGLLFWNPAAGTVPDARRSSEYSAPSASPRAAGRADT